MLQDSIARAKQSLKASYWPDIVRSINDDQITYLDGDALNDLHRRVTAIEARPSTEGILIAAGCALSGSAVVMAAAKRKARPLYVYDVFRRSPYPESINMDNAPTRWSGSSGASAAFESDDFDEYRENILEKVVQNFEQHGLHPSTNNVRFVKGLLEDTLRINAPVALAHIDGDDYENVMTCLERITPKLLPRGVLVFDSYDTHAGCRKAVDEYFADKASEYNFVRETRLQAIKR